MAERDAYRATAGESEHDRALNADLLEALLDQLLPRSNKEGFESYSLLFWELDKLGVTTTKGLKEMIGRHLSSALEVDRKSVEQLRTNGATDARTNAGVFFSYSGLIRTMFEKEFGEDYYSRIWKAAESDREKTRGREPAG